MSAYNPTAVARVLALELLKRSGEHGDAASSGDGEGVGLGAAAAKAPPIGEFL